MSEVERLAQVLQARFGHVVPSAQRFGWPHPALNVIDCVLSLNRRYDGFVMPRLRRFARQRSDVHALQQLRDLIDTYESPLAFSVAELNYNDAKRAQTLRGMTQYLIEAQQGVDRATEMERLQQWAMTVAPTDYTSARVGGIGLAAWQYMRMLFGVQTTKPDVHIRRFVGEAIGRPVNDVQALVLLEQAASRACVPIREVDGAIWQSRARGPDYSGPLFPEL